MFMTGIWHSESQEGVKEGEEGWLRRKLLSILKYHVEMWGRDGGYSRKSTSKWKCNTYRAEMDPTCWEGECEGRNVATAGVAVAQFPDHFLPPSGQTSPWAEAEIFFKSLNQVTIFSPSSLSLPSHSPLLLPTAATVHSLPGGGERLQNCSRPPPARLHMEPGSARDSSGGSRWVSFLCAYSWASREQRRDQAGWRYLPTVTVVPGGAGCSRKEWFWNSLPSAPVPNQPLSTEGKGERASYLLPGLKSPQLLFLCPGQSKGSVPLYSTWIHPCIGRHLNRCNLL